MSLSLKVVSLVAGIGGGCGSVPFLLCNSQGLTSAQTQSPQAEPSLTESSPSETTVTSTEPASTPAKAEVPAPSATLKEETGNCVIEDKLSDLDTMAWNNGIADTDYFRISCKDTLRGLNSDFTQDWSGLFPKKLFQITHDFYKGKKLELKMQITTLEGKSRVEFTSDRFISTVLGKWNREFHTENNQKIKIINIQSSKVSPDKIYMQSIQEKDDFVLHYDL